MTRTRFVCLPPLLLLEPVATQQQTDCSLKGGNEEAGAEDSSAELPSVELSAERLFILDTSQISGTMQLLNM
ncbi:hypothetical protein AAFF_G00034940 [Aldrovandia affinis]|uniref:Uncharacterized protein n=1 Tax=Aldrovandia affinis TaxID=143900 RepID=A0AAD7WFP7_9TELE|nr:hypothetical protein AAFF_G00034940 [Aldrovandia affinis]